MNISSAINFYRGLGVSRDNISPLILLRASRRYIREVKHTSIENAKQTVASAFHILTHMNINEYANGLDSTMKYDESYKKLRPLKKSTRDAINAADMKTSDEIFQTTTMSEDIGDTSGIILSLTSMGDMEMTDGEADFQISEDWFGQAFQDILDRATTGERLDQIIYDYSLRFATFFDGSVDAFEFATCAFAKKLDQMNIPICESIAYNGKEIIISPIGKTKLYISTE